MSRRYQVFISSTYEDLKDARQEISKTLLRNGCFPAGMELFPAADEAQFDFIKRVIDDCDYYIIVSAGRYGSIEPSTGLSYTELEYDYALSREIPVIRLLHKEPFRMLRGEFIEPTDAGKAKLTAFRAKMKAGTLVGRWEHHKELAAEVGHGLTEAIRQRQATGWIKGDGPEVRALEARVGVLEEQVTAFEEKAAADAITLREDSLKSEFFNAANAARFSGRIDLCDLLGIITHAPDDYVDIAYFKTKASRRFAISENDMDKLIEALQLDSFAGVFHGVGKIWLKEKGENALIYLRAMRQNSTPA